MLDVSAADSVPVTAVESSPLALALHVGRLTAFGLDVPAEMSRLCSALPESVGVVGAVVMLVDGSDHRPVSVHASGPEAAWIGEVQRRADNGPLPNAIRSGRPMLTADLIRIGPPELAAAAAETGISSSLVVPMITAGDERVGGLQLLGSTTRPAVASHAEAVRPLAEAIAARIADVRRMTAGNSVPPAGPADAVHVDSSDVATVALRVPQAAAPEPLVVPSPRRPGPPRHRRPPTPWPTVTDERERRRPG